MKKINTSLFLGVIILSLFGLLMIYSSSSIWAEYKFGDAFKYVKNQMIFFFLGIIIMYIVSRYDYHNYYKYANKIFLVCFFLMIFNASIAFVLKPLCVTTILTAIIASIFTFFTMKPFCFKK